MNNLNQILNNVMSPEEVASANRKRTKAKTWDAFITHLKAISEAIQKDYSDDAFPKRNITKRSPVTKGGKKYPYMVRIYEGVKPLNINHSGNVVPAENLKQAREIFTALKEAILSDEPNVVKTSILDGLAKRDYQDLPSIETGGVS